MRKNLSTTKAAKESRERRVFYKSRGICIECGREFAELGHVRCKACADKFMERKKERDPDGSKHREYLRNLREYRRAHGICIDCKRYALPGHVKCSVHINKELERKEVKRIRERIRKQAIEDGIVLGV